MADWTKEFESLIIDDNVVSEFRHNKYFPLLEGKPEAVFRPQKKTDILKIIKFTKKRNIPLIPVSSAWDFHGSSLALQGGIIIDLRQLKSVEKVRECFDGMSADIEPGVTFHELNEKLKGFNLRAILPLRMPDSASVLSTYSGKNHLLEANKYGYHQDWMILTYQMAISKGYFIGMGSEGLETGGDPGDYPFSPRADLGRMFLGGLGAFGIITRITAKLKYNPEKYKFLFTEQENLNEFLPKFREITLSTDAGQTALITDPKILSSYLAKSKSNYTNVKNRLPPWMGIIAVAGNEELIEVEIADLMEAANSVGLHLSDEGPIPNMSQMLEEIFRGAEQVGTSFDFAPHLRIEFYTTAGRLPGIRSKMEDFLKKSKTKEGSVGFLLNSLEMGRTYFCEYDLFYDTAPKKIEPESLPQPGELNLLELYEQSYKTIIEAGGVINVPRNSIISKLLYPRVANYYEMMRVLKYCVDPANLMHPSSIFAGEGGLDPKTIQIAKEVSP